MANGELCKYCGHQETAHELRHEYEDCNQIRDGYKKSLAKCKKFVSEEPEEIPDPKKDAFFFAVMDRQAERRAAFGMYSTIIREQNLQTQFEKIEKEGGGNIEERKAKLLASIRTGGLYIG